jgi:hypothetical protein
MRLPVDTLHPTQIPALQYANCLAIEIIQKQKPADKECTFAIHNNLFTICNDWEFNEEHYGQSCPQASTHL